MNQDKDFLTECRFAKVVQTPKGEALLIGGRIFYIEGPAVSSGDLPLNFIDLFARAMRNQPPLALASDEGGSIVGFAQGSAA